MANLIKKENITIITGVYTDDQGNEKSRYRTIGELVTMQGDDGSHYQFGELWGPHGSTNIKIYDQQPKQQSVPLAAPQQSYAQPPQPQQQYNQAPPPPGYDQRRG